MMCKCVYESHLPLELPRKVVRQLPVLVRTQDWHKQPVVADAPELVHERHLRHLCVDLEWRKWRSGLTCVVVFQIIF
jgi:hypothetical protein